MQSSTHAPAPEVSSRDPACRLGSQAPRRVRQTQQAQAAMPGGGACCSPPGNLDWNWCRISPLRARLVVTPLMGASSAVGKREQRAHVRGREHAKLILYGDDGPMTAVSIL